jgi:hypothetical protein
MRDKRLTNQQLLGTQGTGLIEVAVSGMGFVWRPTSQHDTGVDGEIEIRDTVSGRMTGILIKVQSKAVSAFANESDTGFDYWPEERDVHYWLAQSVPTILIVSRPQTKEVYWRSVNAHVEVSPTSKAFHFVKERDRLDDSARGKLIAIGQSSSAAAVAPRLRKSEVLTANLLPLTTLPPRLYLAETTLKDAKEVGEVLGTAGIKMQFILKNKRILTVQDLYDSRYSELCDRGTVEDFPVEVWSASNDPERQRDFVALLNRCLRGMLQGMPENIWFDRDNACYYFPPSENRRAYDYAYRGDKKATAREVFKVLINRKEGHVMGYRHSAMRGQFLRYGDKWYLEVTPTYFFSKNGSEQSRLHPEWLKGIKMLEKNGAVRGQLVMWADILLNPPDLFDESYPFLAFGQPLSFAIDHGIDDDAWAGVDASDKSSVDGNSAPLFEML